MDPRPASTSPKILVAPLDWGLGHASRCIPLIRSLLKGGAEVCLAADGGSKNLLLGEFPELKCYNLPGYGVKYSRKAGMLPLTLAGQLPHILYSIKKEQNWLQNAARTEGFDAIISDNRYGLFHKSIPSIFITHQLRIQTLMGQAADSLLQSLHYRYINRFSQCWVPDKESTPNLAGNLSHPTRLPKIPVSYIGPLSRFTRPASSGEKILVLLSGPEPQRTMLEELLMPQLKELDRSSILVRGLPDSKQYLPSLPTLEIHNHLPTGELEKKINESAFVISRCGYSTVMDMTRLQKKCILIPTPGQTEQIYLARHLQSQGLALCYTQKSFNLQQAIREAEQYNFTSPEFNEAFDLDAFILNFIERVKTTSKNIPATSPS